MDTTASLAAAIVFIPIACLIAVAIKLESKGPALYWSARIGENNRSFSMPKFRSMKINTPAVATDKLQDPKSHLTRLGGFLRKSSLDEIPQLWCVLTGDMSLVGPRPALYNQYDLIKMRTEAGVHTLKPGITGWAQINGRDVISLEVKVLLDTYYLEKRSAWFDVKIIWLTALSVLKRESVSH